MKELTIGVFESREDAERAIDRLHSDLDIDHDDISYIYRSTDGQVREVDARRVASRTPREGAKTGAVVGGAIGALAGIAGVVGAVPIVGPIIAAGPLAAALGLTGAIGATAGGAAVGAASGGLIGALMNIGVGEEYAQRYSDRVHAGDVLGTVHSEGRASGVMLLEECGADQTTTYAVTV